uniref:Uncharacterized protein n=1 Tax=Picea glauca TaxID=3330 RepID=A0A101LWC5_PICGL|nr:hypothetical protein ABT39_MTgene1633 [Picea glauca]
MMWNPTLFTLKHRILFLLVTLLSQPQPCLSNSGVSTDMRISDTIHSFTLSVITLYNHHEQSIHNPYQIHSILYQNWRTDPRAGTLPSTTKHQHFEL